MPDRTPPVVTKSEIIAQFIPCVGAAFGAPKHVEQAYKDLARNMTETVVVLINDIMLFF